MFTGLTLANVLGAGPGHGWRSTFWVVSGIGLIAVAALAGLAAGPHPHAGRQHPARIQGAA